MRRIAIAVLACASIIFMAGASLAQKASLPRPTSDIPGHPMGAPPPGPGARSGPALAPASADTTVYRLWTFDNISGGADPQGWTTYDATTQADTFFHVDDFAGLGGGSYGRLTPLAGARSLWCGLRPGTVPPACSYANLPGYGNGWDQRFESIPFTVSGNVTVGYKIRTDSEAGYDFVHVDYLSVTGVWRTVASYDGINNTVGSVVISSDSLAGHLKLRFRFYSDAGFSDEDGNLNTDGAVIIDDITVTDAHGVVDSQNFESTAVGARATADGHWHASVAPPYGDYAALFAGSTVLQQDPLVTNTTHFWGFFNGSTANYGCAGHPEQATVPYGRLMPAEPPGGAELYLKDFVISPAVPVPTGLGTNSTIVLQFDIYRDLSVNASVFWELQFRSRSGGGCWGPWRPDSYVYYGPDKDWYRAALEIKKYIDPGATEFQVAIGAVDLFGLYGTGTCHSHAPLVDNVRLLEIGGEDEFVVTNTNATGAGSLYQAIVNANAMSTKSVIRFNIPGSGPFPIDCSGTALPTVTQPVAIDGTTQPGYAGSPLITIYMGRLSITGGNSEIKGLAFSSNSTTDDLSLRSNLNHVHGSVFASSRYGVYITGNGNLVGGTGAGESNEIKNNSTGVYVYSGTGNTIRANRIHDNTNLGIDLSPLGVTANDSGDADTGANDLLNYPTLDYVTYGSPGGVGGTFIPGPSDVSTVDFYASSSCDASGYGEGAIYLGSATVTVLPDYSTHFYASLASVPAGTSITATATDSHGSTSEFSACQTATANTFVVTNAQDSGAGSLRAAITSANSAGGSGVITFNIPGPETHRITLSSTLPSIVHPIVIDGFSQPGTSPNTNLPGQPDNAVVKIEILSPNDGLNPVAGPSLIRGLSLIGGTQGLMMEAGSTGHVSVEGCRIGVDASGTTAVPNNTGVVVYGTGNMIGGLAPEARNIISGNTSAGVRLLNGGSDRIYGNLIGVAADGVTPLGNGGNGVNIANTTTGNCVVGGEAPGAGNLIAHNTGAGVGVTTGLAPIQNPIVGNSIFGNGGLGIDLGNNGVTANDAGDGDTGPNNLQNFPVLSGAVAHPATTSITGTLNSASNQTFRIHCYASPACDASGYGEGTVYLGASNVVTNGSGNANLAFDLPVTTPGGWRLTATATDPLGNTSEFSSCVEIINTPSGSLVVTAPVDLTTGAEPLTLTFDNVTGPGVTTLVTGPTGPPPPPNFEIGNSTYYAISTTATFTGNIDICIAYDEGALTVPESDLRLLHWDTSKSPPQWVDITSSLNTITNVICGQTDHLSPFVLGVGSVTGVTDNPVPARFALRQNYPNPFNPITAIGFEVPAGGASVHLAIYDVTGRLVRTLVKGRKDPGVHTVRWDGRNERGVAVATGVYFYRMQAGSFTQTRKMVLLR